jgi:hypothetical protein
MTVTGVHAAGTTRMYEPISFTLYPGVAPPDWVPPNDTTYYCPDLQGVTIQGTGTFALTAVESTNPDGSTHTELDSTVMGWATDSMGGTYRFTYHNHTAIDIAAGGYPVTRLVSDSFNLVGNGAANQLHTHFVLTVTFTAPGQPPQVNFINVHGAPGNCDPI